MNIYLQSYRVVIFRNSWVLGLLQRNIFQCLGHISEGGKIIQNLSRKDFICIMSRIMGDGSCCVIDQALLVLSFFSIENQILQLMKSFVRACSHFLVVGFSFLLQNVLSVSKDNEGNNILRF